ncbi:hypothetical protein LL037_11945 [Clostridium estertheticum]|uniref:Uncharacterized protein n=1 Tax=Clostridium estertheticum TaxID=238834 RepID=A0A5N7ILI3_9CLOT|nr:hypothetical protein [Clostridium estertheticum]MBU3172414.1 hypothetical protein [Clostridium estertheticum]MBU3201954.1 hypothetical protein [Clostridium estertheticum]MCB2340202.1 hypothetical protein [Clostridium estertheticum]MPQ31170.1 hypothetical protein [Clostridium estertheticum]MPQ61845.1 hypothetical protein [Clostridium estertheticum]
MANEICPHCRALRDTVVSTFEKEIKEDEDIFKVVTKNYHCSMCNSFIRCEDIKHLIIKI